MKRLFVLASLLFFAAGLYAEDPNKGLSRLETGFYVCPRTGDRHIDMSADWQLYSLDGRIESASELSGRDYISVATPTSVQMAYYNAGKLPAPYEHLNSKLYTYLEQQAHYYRKTFPTPALKNGDNVYFSFEGIDYDARIWVNGKCIGAHTGMFGGPTLNVGALLKAPGAENEIVVEVLSANWMNPGISSHGPHDKMHSWYFSNSYRNAPPFYHVGMWNSSRLDILPACHIERPFLSTRSIAGGRAVIDFSAELFAGTSTNDYVLNEPNMGYSTNPLDPRSTVVNRPVRDDIAVRVIFHDGDRVAYEKVFKPYVIEGRCWMEESFELDSPKLWYPNGMGDPFMYRVSVVLDVNGAESDRIDFDYGVRTIEHVRSAGVRTKPRWNNWQYVINGEKIFVKGMNWTPVAALSDLKYENYDWAIRAAKDMGVQILRIWGSGYLETEAFYDCCNKYGIMVWQDFSIANTGTSLWPQKSWESLVCHNIFRLRNQPSLAVWSGGNEFNSYDETNTTAIGILERSIAEFDPTRMFVRASPDGGSIHCYPDFDPNWYKGFDLIPYFSETGIHCMSDARGNRRLINASEFCELDKMTDESFPARHPEFIHHFLEYEPSRVPRMLSRATHIGNVSKLSYEDMVEASQIGAGEFYQVMSESIQSNYPVTTGLMIWTYKRPSPVVAAINLMDYFGQPTAPYYFMKRTYEPVHVLLDMPRLLYAPGDKFAIKANVLNGARQDAFSGSICVKVMNDKFESVAEFRTEVSAPEGTSVSKYEFGEYQIPDTYHEKYFFISAILYDRSGKAVSRSNYWPRTIKQMEDKEFYDSYLTAPREWPSLASGPWLKPTVAGSKTKLAVSGCSGIKDGAVTFTVTNNGRKPSPFTYMEVSGDAVFYCSDNYFWLEPGESRVVTVNIKDWSPDGIYSVSVKSWNATSCRVN